MIKKRWIVGAILLLIGYVSCLAESSSLIIKLRFIAGFLLDADNRTDVVTSYYLKPQFSGSIVTDFEPEKEIDEIRKVFHLNGVSLLTDVNLTWDSGFQKNVFQVVQVGQSEFLVQLTPRPRENETQFRIEVFEKRDFVFHNLLDTQLILPYSQVAILGFQDSHKKPYFISFHVEGGVMGMGETGTIAKIEGAVTVGTIPNDFSLGQGQKNIPMISDKQLPRLLRMVKPVYYSTDSRISGTVVIEAVIDANGKISGAQVISSDHPFLSRSALNAIRQWIYEPYRENGLAIPVRFRAIVNFTMVDVSSNVRLTGNLLDMFFPEKRIDSAKVPPIVKKIEPLYPAIALKTRVHGVVMLDVAIDMEGKVKRVRVVSGHPILNTAAITAVKQWIFQPYREKGKAVAVQFNMPVHFILEAAPKNEFSASSIQKANEDQKIVMERPNLLQRVNPTYPTEAMLKGIQGVVVLEVQTDLQGNVASIRTLEGHPLLQEAASQAVKQWKYEPYLENGQPKPFTFNVTVQFNLPAVK